MTAISSMPERIGRFRLRSLLGRGAMGVVYLGHDEEIDRLVAIKLIRADLLDTEERDSYLKRFRNEAKIAGRCVHANIVGLYDFAMHEGNPYLVMEYVNGVGLQQLHPRGSKRPVDEVIHIALQVLDALHYAHHRGIVHRDIKPANILVTPDHSLKITDFGISRLTSMELTATPLLIGTPSYMSPEQCIGSELDGRNDLFSLGCVLYELVAGERAFAGVNYTESIFAIVNKPHVPLERFRDDLPPGFADAIDKALAKKPGDRYADAAAFARALDEIARAGGLTPAAGMPAIVAEPAALATAPPFEPPGDPTDATLRDRTQATIAVPLDESVAEPVRAQAPEPDADATLILPAASPTPPIPAFAQQAERDSGSGADRGAASLDDASPDIARPDIARPQVPRFDAERQADRVDPAERARIADCLATVIGPIAPLLIRRTEKPGMDAASLADGLALHVRDAGERAEFLGLVRRASR